MNEPALRVVRGRPTDEELAALVAVLSRRAREAAPEGDDGDAPGWARTPSSHPGPGAWRASARLPGVRTRAAW